MGFGTAPSPFSLSLPHTPSMAPRPSSHSTYTLSNGSATYIGLLLIDKDLNEVKTSLYFYELLNLPKTHDETSS